MACKTTPAPKNMPVPASEFPIGPALATLTKEIPNARLVREDGTVVNMADLLSCICAQTTATVDALTNVDIWIGAQTITGSDETFLAVPAGAKLAVIKNDGEDAEFSYDGENWSTLAAGSSVTASASMELIRFRPLNPENSQDVTVNFFGETGSV